MISLYIVPFFFINSNFFLFFLRICAILILVCKKGDKYGKDN